MAKILSTKGIAEDIKKYVIDMTGELREDGKEPGLGILRMGENPSDIAYENSINNYAESVGINTFIFEVDDDVEEEQLTELVEEINDDERIDGLLIFRPLPEHIDFDDIKNEIMPLKDIDGITDSSVGGLYNAVMEADDEIMASWLGTGFPPCTAEACMLILDRYGVDIKGKRAVVIGRSDVIGKPVSLMLLNRDATVTICHSKTENLKDITKEADILIVANGQPKSIGKEYVSPGQTVIDVGIHVNDDGSMCGDVDFEDVENIVHAITPVPGGVGGLTTALLIKHVVDAAMILFIIENEIEFEEEGMNTSQPLENSKMEVKGKVISFKRPEDKD